MRGEEGGAVSCSEIDLCLASGHKPSPGILGLQRRALPLSTRAPDSIEVQVEAVRKAYWASDSVFLQTILGREKTKAPSRLEPVAQVA